MVNLIKNELYKVKFSKILASEIFLILLFIVFIKFSKKTVFEISLNLIPFVEILTIVIFSGILSDEISSGTFKFYLTKPASRLSIYVSKTGLIMAYSYISVLNLGIFSFIFSQKIDFFYLGKLFSYSIPIFLISAQILYFSSKIRSKSFAICYMTLLISFSLFLTQIFLDRGLNFIKFTFLPYLDFSIFDDPLALSNFNLTYNTNINIKSGILIDIFYTILFLVMGLVSFLHKDIKA